MKKTNEKKTATTATAKTESKVDLAQKLMKVKTTDKSLKDQINYALKQMNANPKKVTIADLKELLNLVEAKQPKQKLQPVEASAKTASKTKTAPKKESKPESKPEAKKTLKKPTESKAKVETIPSVSNVGIDKLPSAKIFPDKIEIEDVGTLKKCSNKYTKIDDFIKDVEAGKKVLYLACYWSKRQIKEYGYSTQFQVQAPKNGFENDLDISQAVIPCQTIKRVFAMSIFTEAMYRFDGSDFTPIADTDPRSGEQFKVRVSEGMEFEVYELTK